MWRRGEQQHALRRVAVRAALLDCTPARLVGMRQRPPMATTPAYGPSHQGRTSMAQVSLAVAQIC